MGSSEQVEAGHTPGEWYAEEPPMEAFDEGWFVMAPKPFAGGRYFTDEPVAECCGDGDRQEADARLIAAAPLLLAELKRLTALVSGLQLDGADVAVAADLLAATIHAEDAIAKATASATPKSEVAVSVEASAPSTGEQP